MKLNRLAVYALVASALNPLGHAYGAPERELPANASPIVRVRVGPSNRLRSSGQSGWVLVTVNGKPVDFQGSAPVQAQGKILVPLRPIAEALGAQVTYNPATNVVNATRAGYRLTLQEGAYTMDGKTLVPLRTLSEALGVRVSATNSSNLMRIALTPTHNGHAGVTVISRTPRPRPAAPTRPSQNDGITTANIQYNLKQLNAIRAKAGAPPLKLDTGLNEFAGRGSLELMQTHVPHGHFSKANVWQNGFERNAAENQGDPHGWFPGPVNQSIDQILKAMMDEGPGGGHHDNIINPAFRRVGIGLIKDANGRLYFTNDFSG